MFEKEPSPKLRGYAVWVPKRSANEGHVGPATATASDPRIQHFWDEKGLALTIFRGPLNMNSDVWDVYLIYPPGARWEGSTPPVPTYWMHQLEVLWQSTIPQLDGAVFATHARELLPRGS